MPSKPLCSICSGTVFEPGPKGRLSPGGILPRCATCGSLERHRTFRLILDPLAPYVANGSILQFSVDSSLPRHNLKEVEVSQFGGANHLDLMAIDKPDDSVGFVVCNHVLEHVADDAVALRELDRILTPDGALFLTVPDLLRVARTREYGRACPDKHGHFRVYGPDIAERWRSAVPAWRGLGVVASDPVTGEPDRATILSRSAHTLAGLHDRLVTAGFAPFDAFAGAAPAMGGAEDR